MGAFNTIIGSYKTPCCSHEQSDWQSKRAEVKATSGRIYHLGSLMQTLHIEDIYNGEIHTQCQSCEHFVECIFSDGKFAEWKDRGLPIRREANLCSRSFLFAIAERSYD